MGRIAVRLALVACAVAACPAAALAQSHFLAWDPNADSYTVGYRVFGGPQSGAYSWNVDVGTATSAPLPDLTQAGDYYFAVRAYNSAGALGPASAELSVTVGPPGAPAGLSASAAGSRITLSWGVAPGFIPPSNYLLYVGTAPGASNIANGVAVGNRVSVSGDLGRGRYYARVQASNRFGAGPVSPEIEFDVNPGAPGVPTGLGQAWQGTIVTLTWSAVGGAAGYIVEAGNAPGLANLARISTGANRISVDVPPGTFYVRVRAVNANGESGPSNEIVVRGAGAPNAPTGFSATVTATSVTLRWTGPATGPSPANYLLEAGSGPGLANLAGLQLGTQVSYTAQRPPAGRYYLRVRAVNARGASAPSNEVTLTVP